MTSTKNNPSSVKKSKIKTQYLDVSQTDHSDIAERFRKFKDYTRLTFGELAERTKIRPSTLNNYCTGSSLPTIDTLRILKREFGLTYDWVIDEDGEMIDKRGPKGVEAIIQTLASDNDIDALIASMESVLSRLKKAKKAAHRV